VGAGVVGFDVGFNDTVGAGVVGLDVGFNDTVGIDEVGLDVRVTMKVTDKERECVRENW
jgi:hypothetical protein